MLTRPRKGPGAPDQRARVKLVVLGGSAGGLEPLLRILGPLRRGFPAPVLVVLHVAERRQSTLVEVLAQRLQMPVLATHDKQQLTPGTVFVAGPDYHLLVERDGRVALSDDVPEHYSRPSIDLLFRSAADAFGAAVVAVLLSGASEDGAQGLAAVRVRGGAALVQNPDEAAFNIAPRAAIAAQSHLRVLYTQQIHSFLAALEEYEA